MQIQSQTETVVYKLSNDLTAQKIYETKHSTIMLADENWKSFVPHNSINANGFGVLICSGKVTTIRAILDKVKHNKNIERLIICLSSNNYDAPSAVNLFTNINSSLLNKFSHCKIFITLIGISESLNNKQKEALETINYTIRSKSSRFNIITPPDIILTTNGYSFADSTRHEFFNCLNHFYSERRNSSKTSNNTPHYSNIKIYPI